MFILTTIVDTIRVPADMLSLPTLVALHKEIDLKYPNRVLMDVGVVICRYGDCLKITNGTCVPGDGGSHHECLFRLVVFRPFVEEVCIGKIIKSSAEGVHVSLGEFFQDIFIPAYWMLRPSHYDEKVGLWVWTPNYDEEEGEETTDDVKEDPESSNNAEGDQNESVDKKEGEGDRFEMEIGAEIRFKVKSIQFTQVTNTAKGVQATTTTTAHSHSIPKEQQEEKTSDKPLRKRSLSLDLSEANDLPPTMHIVASICEDGLGLTSWWTSEGGEEEEEEGDAEAEGDGDEDGVSEGKNDDGEGNAEDEDGGEQSQTIKQQRPDDGDEEIIRDDYLDPDEVMVNHLREEEAIHEDYDDGDEEIVNDEVYGGGDEEIVEEDYVGGDEEILYEQDGRSEEHTSNSSH